MLYLIIIIIILARLIFFQCNLKCILFVQFLIFAILCLKQLNEQFFGSIQYIIIHIIEFFCIEC